MLRLSRYYDFFFTQRYSRLPYFFWLPILFLLAACSLALMKGAQMVAPLMIYSAVVIPFVYRHGMISTLPAIALLFFLGHALRGEVETEHHLFYIGILSSIGVSYLLLAFIGAELEGIFSSQFSEGRTLRKDRDLWRGRFESLVGKLEREKQAFEEREEAFHKKEEDYLAGHHSMKEVLTVSYRENQRLFEQNEELVRQLSDQLQKIAQLERGVDRETSDKEIARLQQELNESRTQHYQDKLLYDHYKEERAKQELASKGVEVAIEENMEKNSSENIYLNPTS